MSERSDNILLHLVEISHHNGVNKLLNLINHIIYQFQQTNLCWAISSVNEHVSVEVRDKLLKTIILEAMLTRYDTDATIKFCDYVKEALTEFTKEEELSILENINLKYIDAPHDLFNIVYTAILKAFTITNNIWWKL